MTANSELRELRLEFVHRVEGHPVSEWPADLLRIINAAVDLYFGADNDDKAPVDGARAKLRVVK